VPVWVDRIFRDSNGQLDWGRVGTVIVTVVGAVWAVLTFVVEHKDGQDKTAGTSVTQSGQGAASGRDTNIGTQNIGPSKEQIEQIQKPLVDELAAARDRSKPESIFISARNDSVPESSHEIEFILTISTKFIEMFNGKPRGAVVLNFPLSTKASDWSAYSKAPAYRVKVINDNSSPLLNIELTLHVELRDPNTPNAFHKEDYQCTIPRVNIGERNEYIFYIVNMSDKFVFIEPEKVAYGSTVSQPQKREIAVIAGAGPTRNMPMVWMPPNDFLSKSSLQK
jgi:hypothetical protein